MNSDLYSLMTSSIYWKFLLNIFWSSLQIFSSFCVSMYCIMNICMYHHILSRVIFLYVEGIPLSRKIYLICKSILHSDPWCAGSSFPYRIHPTNHKNIIVSYKNILSNSNLIILCWSCNQIVFEGKSPIQQQSFNLIFIFCHISLNFITFHYLIHQ